MDHEQLVDFLDRLHTIHIDERIAQADQLIAGQNQEALPGCLAWLQTYQALADCVQKEIDYDTAKNVTPAPQA